MPPRVPKLQIEEKVSCKGAIVDDRPEPSGTVFDQSKMQIAVGPRRIYPPSRAGVVGYMTFVKVVADHVDDHSAGAVLVHGMAGPDQVLAEWSARCAEAVDPQSALESICQVSVQGVAYGTIIASMYKSPTIARSGVSL